jgi:hypothetical protein
MPNDTSIINERSCGQSSVITDGPSFPCSLFPRSFVPCSPIPATINQMRRGFSIFLILLFGLGPLSAMVDGSEDAGLPACCRRDGAHHCAMSMHMVAAMARIVDPNPSFDAPLTCPNYPGPVLAILTPSHAIPFLPADLATSKVSAPVPVAETATAYSTLSLTHSGRGPPFLL